MTSPNPWQALRAPSTVTGMAADHYAQIVTPRGSTVVFPNLDEQDAERIAAEYGPPSEFPVAHPVEAAEKRPCGRCGGAGGWEETVETTSKSGSKVVTKKWVNCRPCGGTGSVPK